MSLSGKHDFLMVKSTEAGAAMLTEEDVIIKGLGASSPALRRAEALEEAVKIKYIIDITNREIEGIMVAREASNASSGEKKAAIRVPGVVWINRSNLRDILGRGKLKQLNALLKKAGIVLVNPHLTEKQQAEAVAPREGQLIIQGLGPKSPAPRRGDWEGAVEIKYMMNIKKPAIEVMVAGLLPDASSDEKKAAIIVAGAVWTHQQELKRILGMGQRAEVDSLLHEARCILESHNLTGEDQQAVAVAVAPMINALPSGIKKENIVKALASILNDPSNPLRYKVAAIIAQTPKQFKGLANFSRKAGQIIKEAVKKIKAEDQVPPEALYVVQQIFRKKPKTLAESQLPTFMPLLDSIGMPTTRQSLVRFVDEEFRNGRPLAAAIRIA
ncbi:MAG: hypothetical protein ABSE90_07650 [Verrucomicrobiota bacterium]